MKRNLLMGLLILSVMAIPTGVGAELTVSIRR